MEEWRNVPGSKGQYQIRLTESGGICRSTNYKGTGRVKEFSNTPNKNGRLYWNLQIEGRTVTYQAGRWIALTYPELVQNEYFEGAEIDHIDTNPLNSHPSNLRWVDKKGQQNNPLTKKHISEGKKGKTNPKKFKPVLKYDSSKKLLVEYSSVVEAARQTGVSKSVISNYCNHKRIDRQGYYWEFKEREAV